MRSSRLTAAGLALLASWGCGSDGNGPNPNANPTANFTSACTDLACTFTDLSSDSDGNVTAFSWDFGDNAASSSQNPGHTYAGPGTYTVSLTATDNDGGRDSHTQNVTVTAAQAGGPTADFTVLCASFDCTFTDGSLAGTSAIVGWAWDFGDGATSSAQNPAAHHYTTTDLTVFTVQLTVTDNNGLTSTRTKQITVSPPATLTCSGAACTLGLVQAATVTVTLTSRECTAHGNQFVITAPIVDTLFTDGCYAPPVGTSFPLNGGAVFSAGTQLDAQVISGSIKQEITPALRVTGSFVTGWTLEFDDGEDATPPEPDFNDLVITVTATPQ